MAYFAPIATQITVMAIPILLIRFSPINFSRSDFTLSVGAIVLFGVTLVKLFFYDISDYDTLSKTIVFVSLGILLLIISFLYNKYTHRISDEGGH